MFDINVIAQEIKAQVIEGRMKMFDDITVVADTCARGGDHANAINYILQARALKKEIETLQNKEALEVVRDVVPGLLVERAKRYVTERKRQALSDLYEFAVGAAATADSVIAAVADLEQMLRDVAALIGDFQVSDLRNQIAVFRSYINQTINDLAE